MFFIQDLSCATVRGCRFLIPKETNTWALSLLPFPSPFSPCEEPMQRARASCAPTGGITFTPEGCHCKMQGHSIRQCPKLKERRVSSEEPGPPTRFSSIQELSSVLLMLSGVENIAFLLSTSRTAFYGCPLGSLTISEITEPLSMYISFENHTTSLSLGAGSYLACPA